VPASRPGGFRLGIAARLVLLVLAATLPFLVLFGLRARERRDEAQATLERATAARARDAADQLDARLREVHAALATLGRAVRPVRAARATNDSLLLATAEVLADLGVILNAYDASGENVGTSVRPAPAEREIDPVRRQLLDRIGRARGLTVGEPERYDSASDPWWIAAGLPIVDRGGRVAGAVAAVMSVGGLTTPLRRAAQDVEDAVVIKVVDADDHVIARVPDAVHLTGRRFEGHPLLAAAASGEPYLGERAGLDGVVRTYATAPLARVPWRVLVGTAPGAAAATRQRLLVRELLVFSVTVTVALVLALTLGRRITRPVRELSADARRLADGDLAHRSEVRAGWEVGTLAATLNQMAASVAQGRDALAASEQRWRLLFERSPLPMWMTDRHTLRFVAVNEAATRQYGWTREEFLAMTLMEVRPPEAREEFGRVVSSEPESDSYRGRWMHWRKDGSRMVVDVSIRDVVLDDQPARLSVLVDVTEAVSAASALERSREELRQTQKMEALGRFAGGIAHDFNNLLTGIIGYADLVMGELPPGSTSRSDVEQLRRTAMRAATLTQQILAFSRRQVLQPQVLALGQQLAGMAGLLSRVIGDHIRVTVQAAPDLWPVLADPSQVEQVLLNLALNARDAMDAGGTLTIAAQNVTVAPNDPAHPSIPPGEWVQVAVRDTGQGMTPEVQARLFEPFFTTKPRGKGTGLGLAMAYGIVEQSGGRMRAESTPGQGASLLVYLPRTHEAPAVVLPARGREREAVGGVVLIAEDEPTVRAVAAEALGRLGYVVLVAADGASALEVAARHEGPIDLLVTDVVMPGMSGPQLADALRARRPGTPVLFMSGYADDDVLLEGVQSAGLPFLPKPFTPAELARRVREAMAASR
jgi:PAS domain S-box-containing protein